MLTPADIAEAAPDLPSDDAAGRAVVGRCGAPRRLVRFVSGPTACGRDQREAAQPDARQDGRAAADQRDAHRVAEDHGSRGGTDQRLEVIEGAGDLSAHPALPVGEQGEGQQSAARHERGDGHGGARAGRRGGHALGDHAEGQRPESGPEELHGSDRDRVAAAQQPGLPDGEHRRQQQRGKHQAVAGQGRASAARARRDQADAA
jgi:hypothetical protein